MNKKQHLSIGLLLLIIFFFVFFNLALDGFMGSNPDGRSHWIMVNEPHIGATYAPLLRILGNPFSAKIEYWTFFIVFLMAVVIPLLILYSTNKWYSVWFYFSTTSFYYYFIQGAYAQSLAISFALGIVLVKDNRLRLLLLLIGSLAHSRAPLLLPVVFILVLLNDNRSFIISELKKVKKFVPFCSVLTGTSSFQKITNSSVLDSPINKVGLRGHEINYFWNGLTITNFISLFVKITPFPFLYGSLRQFIKDKEYHILLLFFFSLLMAWDDGARVWYMFAPFMVYGFTKYFSNSNHKLFWFGLSILWFLFQLEQFYAFSKIC